MLPPCGLTWRISSNKGCNSRKPVGGLLGHRGHILHWTRIWCVGAAIESLGDAQSFVGLIEGDQRCCISTEIVRLDSRVVARSSLWLRVDLAEGGRRHSPFPGV